MFIGTPHNGRNTSSDKSTTGTTLSNLLKFVLENDGIEEEVVGQHSASIASINDKFTNCGQPLEIYSYYENDGVCLKLLSSD